MDLAAGLYGLLLAAVWHRVASITPYNSLYRTGELQAIDYCREGCEGIEQGASFVRDSCSIPPRGTIQSSTHRMDQGSTSPDLGLADPVALNSSRSTPSIPVYYQRPNAQINTAQSNSLSPTPPSIPSL
jgi:hypothetical protein